MRGARILDHVEKCCFFHAAGRRRVAQIAQFLRLPAAQRLSTPGEGRVMPLFGVICGGRTPQAHVA
jgi:hypothetical protein